MVRNKETHHPNKAVSLVTVTTVGSIDFRCVAKK